MENIQLWFRQLQKREQQLLILSTGIIIVTLLYLLIWEPVFETLEQQQLKRANQQKTLSWMQKAATEVNSLRASGGHRTLQSSNQPVSSIVEKTAISAGIRSSIQKINADKKQNIKVNFKTVDFNRLMQWLANLNNNYGIITKHITLNQTESSGMVSCRVTLEKPE